ncbi:MAG: hypothetical protein J6W00_13885 [Lentisphaeria bacterium]|nr:hypothetical protein [Lentisphaeria bacterium]
MKKLLMIACLGAFSLLGAAELFDGAKPGAWESDAEIKDGVVTMNLNHSIKSSKDFIPVTKGKKYTVSGEFFITGNPPAKTFLYFGITPYTAKGEEITHSAIATALPHSIASLAADVKAGDKSLTIKGAESWKILPHGKIAFNAKANRSDLPNFEMTDFPILNKTVKNSDGTITLFFKSPIAKDYPAGTAVRQHRSGNMFVYAGFGDKAGQWMKFSTTFRNFYPGTTQFKVTLRLLNRNWPVQMRNVKVIEE